jgi:hypothetical protein
MSTKINHRLADQAHLWAYFGLSMLMRSAKKDFDLISPVLWEIRLPRSLTRPRASM